MPCGTYYVAWRVNGKLFMRTTGETNLKKAEEKRAEIMQPFAAGDETSVLQNLAARIEGRKAEVAKIADERNPPLALDAAWAAYCASPKRPDSGERTLSDYGGYFTSFSAWMTKCHADKTHLRDVTPAVAAEYAVHLGTIGLSPNSFNKHIRLWPIFHACTLDCYAV